MSKRTNRRATIRLPRRTKFTIAEVIQLNAELNDQTVRTHVRHDLATGTLRVVGKQACCGRGRPAFVLARRSFR